MVHDGVYVRVELAEEQPELKPWDTGTTVLLKTLQSSRFTYLGPSNVTINGRVTNLLLVGILGWMGLPRMTIY